MGDSTPDQLSIESSGIDVLNSKAEKNGKSKSRRKELRSTEILLKSMSHLTTDDKLKVFTEKYVELLEENKSTQSSLKAHEKHIQVLQREKEQLKTENGKSLLARSRLEELCRELQRQNKIVKEESMLRIREEEEQRKEVSQKFQTTLAEVSTLLQQNNEKNQKLREENREMATKLQMLCDQYSLREQHLEKLGKQYEIERQLNEAKLAKIRMDSAEYKEHMLKEKQLLLLELTEYQKKCQAMQEEEVGLRQQLAMYTDKYDDFQLALKSSNQQFIGFKAQMDEMTKKLKSLEKETAQWKSRWEKSNNLLLEMASEKKLRDQEILSTTKQLAQLEKLCRALQNERVSLINEIKQLKAPSYDEPIFDEKGVGITSNDTSSDEKEVSGNSMAFLTTDSTAILSNSEVPNTICEEIQKSLVVTGSSLSTLDRPISSGPSSNLGESCISFEIDGDKQPTSEPSQTSLAI